MGERARIDFRIVIKMALKLANATDVLDPENLAGDMVLISLLAMRAGRINAPTKKSLYFARREALVRFKRWDRRDELREELTGQEPVSEGPRIDEHIWSIRRLQELWPDLTEVEREAMLKLLSGEGDCSAQRRRVVDNAKRRVLSMLRREHSRNPKHVTLGRTGHFKRVA